MVGLETACKAGKQRAACYGKRPPTGLGAQSKGRACSSYFGRTRKGLTGTGKGLDGITGPGSLGAIAPGPKRQRENRCAALQDALVLATAQPFGMVSGSGEDGQWGASTLAFFIAVEDSTFLDVEERRGI